MREVSVYTGSSLLFPLNEPDHIGFPELLISALVSREREVPAWRDNAAGGADQKKLLAYTVNGKLDVRGFETVITEPKQGVGGSGWSTWVEAVKTSMTLVDPDYDDLAAALKESLKGVQIRHSKIQRGAVVPMSTAMALLQNSRGVLGKGGPSNFGLILEQMYSLGNGYSNDASAAALLVRAFDLQENNDVLIRALSSAVTNGIIDGRNIVESNRATHNPVSPSFLAPGSSSPFGWFAEVWPRLTSDAWVSALPARRWIDWATTVLRLSFGLGILWESKWYEELGREILSEGLGDIDPDRIIKNVNSRSLMTWHSRGTEERGRNVQQEIRSTLTIGYHVKSIVTEVVSNVSGLESAGMAEVTSALRNPDVIKKLTQQKKLSFAQTNKSSLQHRWDAVESCLTTRNTLGGNEIDHYGLLIAKGNKNARFRIVEPSTEVMAVIGSLSNYMPDGECRIGDVKRNLRSLGLRPALSELVNALEGAGLCRRTADADESAVVRSAFGLGRN
jgi:hypothetical protein